MGLMFYEKCCKEPNVSSPSQGGLLEGVSWANNRTYPSHWVYL